MAEENGNKEYGIEDHHEALNRVRSAASVSMSPELFEKLYLSPQNAIKGELRKTFANPTAIAIAGFVLCLTPLSCDLMGWRGAGGNGAASIPVYFFQGGILMNLGGLLEWILGNTFPSIVFLVFGTFWLSFAGILSPSFAAFASYAPPDAKSPTEGLLTPGFNASLGFWLLFMGLICLIFLIGSLRTNVCFFLIFLSLVLAFGFLTGAYWLMASGHTAESTSVHRLIVGAGGLTFVTSLLGWWILLALVLAAVDFPLAIPLGDLSGVIKGASDRKR